MAVSIAAAALVTSSTARADGFQLERYEPSAPGSWFFSVEHPWYSSTRWVAAGLTLDYGHNTLLGGDYPNGNFRRTVSIVEHQLMGHVDLAFSFLDRVQLSLTLPVVLRETGTAGFMQAPVDGVAVGDPRVGALVRIWGQPERDVVSLHAGVQLWFPAGDTAHNVGDPGVRFAGQLVLAGFAIHHLRWSVNAGALYRGETRAGSGPGSSIGSELQVRAGLQWTDTARTWAVGPEAWLTTPITGDAAFTRQGSALELLLGGQVNIARQVQVGAGVGTGLISTLGTPDVRVVFRVAWAPVRQKLPGDTDGDGVADAEDLCPDERSPGAGPRARGCTDVDADGVPDAQDLCPRLPPGAFPDGGRSGCPQPDTDEDGVPDAQDLCPDKKSGAVPDAGRSGCPQPDTDEDGVPDAQDLCPRMPRGTAPDRGRSGCPLPDADGDGIADAQDACPRAAAGKNPDPRRRGCPLPDADGDGVPDAQDACPKLVGEADKDAARSGCPHIESDSGSLTELKAVHFNTNKAVLLPEGLPVLDELAALILRHPEVRLIEISGHADDTGTHEFNLRLSRHRAEAVVKYLVKKRVQRKRLKPVGYGDTRPLSDDRSDESRARNRRVELRVAGTQR